MRWIAVLTILSILITYQQWTGLAAHAHTRHNGPVRINEQPLLLVELELSAEERRKRELFLRARDGMRQQPTPKPTPRATPPPTPRATPRPVRRATQEQAPEVRQKEKQKQRVLKYQRTTPPKATPQPQRQKKDSRTTRKQTRSDNRQDDAAVIVHKSGLQQEQGYAPPPEKEKEPNFFQRVFGGQKKYKYLTRSVRNRIDRAKVRKGRWKYIIVHNSGTRQGNAAIFHHYHKNVRKMSNGMAYHFVIGNGRKSGNGQIEIGARWDRQINGGHVASDYLNNIAIGICLVGDFNRDKPTKAQIEALEELIDYLHRRVGKVDGRRSIVKAHKEINPRPTDCPGRRFPYSWLHRKY